MKIHNKIDLDQIKFILTALMTLSLPFSESIKSITVLLALVVFLVQLYKREIIYKLSLIHYGFLLLLLSSIISSILSNDPFKGLSGSKDILFFSIPFFVAFSFDKDKQIRTILWCLFVSTATSALIGIFHSIENSRPLEIHALGNQNYTAMFLTIVLTSVISMVLFSNKENLFKKMILIGLSIVILFAAVKTLMRASFLGLFVFFVFLVSLNLKTLLNRQSKIFNHPILLIIPGFIFLTFLILYLDRAMWQKLFSFKSMISRCDIWEEAVRLFIENPITGVGLNQFEFRFPASHPVEPNNIVYDAHSLYLQTASQMGLIGLSSLAIMFVGFIKGWRDFIDLSGFHRALRYGCLGAFLVIFVAGLFDTTLHHEHAMAFSLVSGFSFGYREKNGV